jgi:pyruvate dehydrogenase E2 component (dihydrolipoamide acetyltransferase)
MAKAIVMPKMSDTMTEGVIANWLKNVGDQVKKGDILAEVETDKATMELECYENGILLYHAVEAGGSVLVDGLLAIVGEAGEDFQSLLSESPQNMQKLVASNTTATLETQATPTLNSASSLSNSKAKLITMPKMSDTMEEGVIANWLKKVGDTIKKGDILAEVETDKATMELESYESGTLLYVSAQEGESVKVDAPLAIIGETGADFHSLLQTGSQPTSNVQKQESVLTAVPSLTSPVEHIEGDRVKISPLARKMAKEKGITNQQIEQMHGTGDGGRIVKRDIDNYVVKGGQPTNTPPAITQIESSTTAPATTQPKQSTGFGQESYEDVAISQMRKTIAKRLSESMFTAPHFYLTVGIRMDNAMKARKEMNEYSEVKLSFNDFVVKACGLALRKHKQINAGWMGDTLRYFEHIHIGTFSPGHPFC